VNWTVVDMAEGAEEAERAERYPQPPFPLNVGAQYLREDLKSLRKSKRYIF